MTGDPAPSEPVKELARRFILDLNTRDLERLLPWFRQDAQLWIPPAPLVCGSQRISLLLKLIFRRYRDIQWEILALYQASEHVDLVEMRSFGVRWDSFPAVGIGPTGP